MNTTLSVSTSSKVRGRMTRRRALQLLATAGTACAVAPGPMLGAEPRPKGLGVCAISYALRWPLGVRGQSPIDEILQFVDHSHAAGAAGVQTIIPTDPEAGAQLRARLERFGMYLEGQVSLPRSPADRERFDQQVQAAKRAGATVLRTACLSGRRYETFKDAESFREFVQQSERSLQDAEPLVRKHRVRLAVENHKDWLISELLRMLRQISSEFVGVCVDTGNSLALLEEPMATVEAYAPYAFSTHLKDMAVQEYQEGFLLAEVPLGQGFLDLRKITALLRRARPEVQFTLEMITRDPLKVPCLAPQYWRTFESLSGASLASTLSLVRANPPKAPLPQISNLAQDEKLRREDEAVRTSIAFAREHLQI